MRMRMFMPVRARLRACMCIFFPHRLFDFSIVIICRLVRLRIDKPPACRRPVDEGNLGAWVCPSISGGYTLNICWLPICSQRKQHRSSSSRQLSLLTISVFANIVLLPQRIVLYIQQCVRRCYFAY